MHSTRQSLDKRESEEHWATTSSTSGKSDAARHSHKERLGEETWQRRSSLFVPSGAFRDGIWDTSNRVSLLELNLVVPTDASFSPAQTEDESGLNAELNSPPCYSRRIRLGMCAVLCFASFLAPLSSTMLIPSLPMVTKDLDIQSDTVKPFLTSIQILGMGVGGLIAAPLSERHGRLPIIHVSNICFVAWTLACARAQTAAGFLAFRALVGLMGTAPGTVAKGVIAEIFAGESRAKAVALLAMSTQLAFIVGPTIGGVLGENLGWHWIFYLLVILGSLNTAFCLVCLKESNQRVLDRRRLYRKGTQSRDSAGCARASLSGALCRPFRLLFTIPVILMPTVSTAVAHGFSYLVLSSLPFTFSTFYDLSATETGLIMITPAVAMMLGFAIPAGISGRIAKARKRQTDAVPTPECGRLAFGLLVPAPALFAAGLLIYGWTAQYRIHIVVPTTGLFLFALGLTWLTFCATTYTMDCYPEWATSVAASNNFLVATANGLLPLSGLELFNGIGLGWGSAIFAAVSLVSSSPLFICRAKGAHLRQKFPLDAG